MSLIRLIFVHHDNATGGGYWQEEDQPFYYSLASVFPIADRYFCSVLGQTFPNRRYLLSATSIGQVNDTVPKVSDYPAKVIRAVMNGPEWASTLLIWTYDEHGGYYDHVPPPRALPMSSGGIAPKVPKGQSAYEGFGRYGFRVPCAVVSPWARPWYVSHQVFDHTSICALVEAKWNLPAMTLRDANAANMLDMLDLRRPAFLKPPPLAKPLLASGPAALSCNITGPGTIPPPGSVTPAS